MKLWQKEFKIEKWDSNN